MKQLSASESLLLRACFNHDSWNNGMASIINECLRKKKEKLRDKIVF